MWVPGAVQLSVCISVNTCTQLHVLHGFTTVPKYYPSTLCTLKVSQQCQLFPWLQHLHGCTLTQNVKEPCWQIVSVSPVPPVSVITAHIPPRTELYQLSPLFCSRSLSTSNVLKGGKVSSSEHSDNYVQFRLSFLEWIECLHLYKVQERLFRV